MTLTPQQRDILVRTVIGEALGEGPAGQAAVAHVILNRASDGRWPSDVAEVAQQPKQFSTWNSATQGGNALAQIGPNDPRYQQVAAVVDGVLSGQTPDPTNGATHFYNPDTVTPTWSHKIAKASGTGARIGNHYFIGQAKTGRTARTSAVKKRADTIAPMLGQNRKGRTYDQNPEKVKAWQQRLADEGYYKGEIDGIFGPKTQVATGQYQAKIGAKVDGIVGDETRMKSGFDVPNPPRKPESAPAAPKPATPTPPPAIASVAADTKAFETTVLPRPPVEADQKLRDKAAQFAYGKPVVEDWNVSGVPTLKSTNAPATDVATATPEPKATRSFESTPAPTALMTPPKSIGGVISEVEGAMPALAPKDQTPIPYSGEVLDPFNTKDPNKAQDRMVEYGGAPEEVDPVLALARWANDTFKTPEATSATAIQGQEARDVGNTASSIGASLDLRPSNASVQPLSHSSFSDIVQLPHQTTMRDEATRVAPTATSPSAPVTQPAAQSTTTTTPPTAAPTPGTLGSNGGSDPISTLQTGVAQAQNGLSTIGQLLSQMFGGSGPTPGYA